MRVVEWVPREPPLAPAAVIGDDETGPLLAALGAMGPGLERLRAVAGGGRVVVLGEVGDLPWFEGARYLGWDGGVLLPTEIRPTLPVDVLRAAAGNRRPGGAPLLAVVPGALFFAETPSRPIDLATLTARPPAPPAPAAPPAPGMPGVAGVAGVNGGGWGS